MTSNGRTRIFFRSWQLLLLVLLLLVSNLTCTIGLSFGGSPNKPLDTMPSLPSSPKTSSTLLTDNRKFHEESESIQNLINQAKSLYHETYGTDSNDDLICTVAPGRVNMIGEHTDYTNGFVFPMAIDYSTVCYGKGSIIESSKAQCRVTSCNKKDGIQKIITFESSHNMVPLPREDPDFWTNYIAGVVDQYMSELQHLFQESLDVGHSISLDIVICGNVPLGSGLSSSAALEVAVATMIETMIGKKFPTLDLGGMKEKALRCQKAENIFCDSPCGIMDQYVSAAASMGSAIWIDCRSLDYEVVTMGMSSKVHVNMPVFVICNSNVKHSIGGGEYPIRVKQCSDATTFLRSVCGDHIHTLRDATMEDVEYAKMNHDMNELIYRRARHVITENQRTQMAKISFTKGEWKDLGRLMNESHESMKNDYEVSCEEIDILVNLAQSFPGVYGSRLTGGGFGGCTVTLVERSQVEALCDHLQLKYSQSTNGNECSCFETSPGPGARQVLLC